MRTTAEIEKKIAMLLGEMTLEEKVSLCHANSKFTVASVERLGIEELTMSDGPHGVRPELDRHSWRNLRRSEDACTYLPTGTALAATWNPTSLSWCSLLFSPLGWCLRQGCRTDLPT